MLRWIYRIADFERLRLVHKLRHEFVAHRFVHQDAGACVARLPCVVEDRMHRARRGCFEVRVFEDDVRRFSAELQA